MVTNEQCRIQEARLKEEIEAVRLESGRADEDLKIYFNEKLSKHSNRLNALDDRMDAFVTWDKFKWITAAGFGFTGICFSALFWFQNYSNEIIIEKINTHLITARETNDTLKKIEIEQVVLNETVKQINKTLGGAEITHD